MTDEDIRKAASEAWEYERGHIGTFCQATVDMSESTICAMIAVYRAGMAAERAQCIEIAQGEAFDTPSGIRTVAYLRAYNDGIYAVVDRLKGTK